MRILRQVTKCSFAYDSRQPYPKALDWSYTYDYELLLIRELLLLLYLSLAISSQPHLVPARPPGSHIVTGVLQSNIEAWSVHRPGDVHLRTSSLLARAYHRPCLDILTID